MQKLDTQKKSHYLSMIPDDATALPDKHGDFV